MVIAKTASINKNTHINPFAVCNVKEIEYIKVQNQHEDE